jgi:1-phosphofructokinase
VIITVTLNPSVDRTVEVDYLLRGGLVRTTGGRVEAGGKGINVARALVAHGIDASIVLPVGGAEGRRLAALLAAGGVPSTLIPVEFATRSNINVVEPDGTITRFTEQGTGLAENELKALCDAVAAHVPEASWATISGSLPDGVPETVYGDSVRRLRGLGIRVAVDTSGPLLLEAASNGARLAMPNRAELAEATRLPINTVGDVVDAGRRLQAAGVSTVLVALGADGAVLVEPDGAWHGEVPAAARNSDDVLLAGFLAADAAGPSALREALAWAAGTSDPVHIHPAIDRQRPLADHI